MRIHSPETRELEETREIAAWVDGFRLWYRAPKSQALASPGDAFVVAALLPAMATGEKLEVEPALAVSPRLLRNLILFQDVYHRWNPALRIVPVEASARPAVRLHEGTLLFFSGGVDSMFTFLKRWDEIEQVAYIKSFDFPVADADFRTAQARNSSFVRDRGRSIVPIETNANDFGYHHNLSVHLFFGSLLASVAHLLGYRRALISAPTSYGKLAPLGSHPLTDPLWSSEAVEIVHEGAEARRIDKIVRLAQDPEALAHLQVCARGIARNCGECHKCVRTMTPLAVLGVSTPAFPPLPALSKIRRMRIKKESESIFVRENYDLAVEKGHRGLRKALGASLGRFDRGRLFKDSDRILFDGLGKRIYRKLVRTPPAARRISMVPPKD